MSSWVSVDDGLPMNTGTVIVGMQDGSTRTANYVGGGDFKDIGSPDHHGPYSLAGVVRWMVMPETVEVEPAKKPLGCKNYRSIKHLPTSHLTSGDRYIDPVCAEICTVKLRDKHDRIYIEEKLDGSNVGVCKVDGKIIAIQRHGHPVDTSPHEQHWLFGHWVRVNESLFDKLLGEGERIAGEWLAQVHSIRYRIPCRRTPNPFVPFDIFTSDNKRVLREEFWDRLDFTGLVPAQCFYRDPIAPETILTFYPESGFHGAIDPPEGFVYRVERRDRFDFLAKWVRPGLIPGEHLSRFSGKPDQWNWKPSLPAVVS